MNRIFIPGQYLRIYTSIIYRKNTLHSSALLRKLVQFNLSDIGEGIAEVQVRDWHVDVGDKVDEFDKICTVESDKASVTITSRYTGTIKKLYHSVDDIAKVGQPLVDIDIPDGENAPEPDEVTASPQTTETEKRTAEPSHKILAAPAVRRMIREHKLDPGAIPPGSGRDGRLLKEDILKFMGQSEALSSGQMGSPKSPAPADSRPALSSSHKALKDSPKVDQIVPIRGYKRAMFKTMTEAHTIPGFGYYDEFTVDKLVEMRKILNDIGKEKGIKLSYMPIIVKATSLALKEFPILNSSIDTKQENIIYKSSHNISLAVDTNEGLIVPNIKNCQDKNIWEIAHELDRLTMLGRVGHFSKEDLEGGTFALSNIGSIGGGTYAKAVILPPQVCIGAIGRIQKLPRYNAKGELVLHHILNFSWTADHRVIDGATMARFSNRLKQLLEEPWNILAELH